jgi:hypothetical protein
MAALAGCTSAGVSNTVGRAGELVDRSREFAAAAPAAPYEQHGNVDQLSVAADANDLQLSGDQLALISGAADAVDVDAALVAYIVEQELRHLDENELDRDVLGALAGENTSVGIAQVKVSTALEVEQEDRWDLFPPGATSGSNETERVRRLAADDWSVLYAAAYLAIVSERNPSDEPLDLAIRYTGASPNAAANGRVDAELFDQMTSLGL